jgi:para-aminobenzoate synthetase/4-amino-4-deoxychorismate lyase
LLAARSGATSLTASDLPPPRAEPIDCIALPLPVDPGDWRLRHKTTDRAFYDEAREVAEAEGAGEALFALDDGTLTEGSWTSIFVERDGKLLTPPLSAGLLPGVLRRSLIEAGKAEEKVLALDDLADGFLLGNSLRGLMPARFKP